MKCKDCDQFQQCGYYYNRRGTSQICSRFTNDLMIIERLNKIKTEIKSEIDRCDDDYEFEEIFGMKKSLKIINKNIEELNNE